MKIVGRNKLLNRLSILAITCLVFCGLAVDGFAQRRSSIDRPYGTVTSQSISDFTVTFLGFVYNDDGTSTWNYRVAWSGQGNALSHFTIGFCPDHTLSDLVSWSPSGSVSVQSDPTTGLYGFKFDFGLSENPQDFSFTINGHWIPGEYEAAVKAGRDVFYYDILAPGCTECTVPNVTLASQTICENESASFTASTTGTGPFTYAWTVDGSAAGNDDDTLTAAEIGALSVGTYSIGVTVTGACGTDDASADLTINDLPEPVGSSSEICEGEEVTLDAGDGFASYSWSPGGATTRMITVSSAGTYTVTVTNDAGCSASADHTVAVNDLPEPAGSNNEICEGEEVTLDAGAGFASYLWSPGGEETQTITVSSAGTYTVTVTNDAGCSASADHTVAVNDLPEPVGSSSEICEGEEVTLDAGDGFASYSWSPGGATTRMITVSPSEDTTYTVTVTNDAGCSASADHTVTVNDLPEPAGSNNEICEGKEVTLDAGDGFASYLWSPGGETTQTITVSSAGTYTVTVTNDNGCSASADHRVAVNDLPEPAGSNSEICEGEEVTLDAGDGFASYSWSPGGETTQTITVSSAGTYSVTVTNDAGCSASADHTVAVNDLPEPVGSNNEICEGEEVTLDAGAGFASYSWSPGGETTQTITVSSAGTYTVTVTNDNGCSASADHRVIVNDLPEPAGSNNEICEGEEVTLDAGAGFASYSWSPGGETTQTITVSSAGTYTVTVTNDAGCSASADHTVAVNDLPQPVGSDHEMCEGESVELDAGEGFASYKWSTGDETQTITVGIGGTYTVTVTNDAGCPASADHTVTVNDLPQPAGSNQAACEGDSVTLDAGAGFASYSWSPGGETTQTITVSAGGTYTVTVTNGNGCSNSAEHTVTYTPCDEFCSLTQGAWGNAGGYYNGETTVQILTRLLSTPLVVGLPGRSATFTDPQCILSRLPGGGKAEMLPEGDAGLNGCAPDDSSSSSSRLKKSRKDLGGLNLNKDGRFTNSLLTQTIALSLNTRWDSNLLLFQLCASFTTKDAIMVGGELVPNPDPGPDGVLFTADDTETFMIPQSVLNYLGSGATVNDLLALANGALGGWGDVPKLSDIVKAVDSINRGFDECRIFIGCGSAVNSLSGALSIGAVNPELALCEQLQPVTIWDVRNGYIGNLRQNVEGPDVPAVVLEALQRLGLPTTVGGLAELERMTFEGHAFLGGAEPDQIQEAARRVLDLSIGLDNIGLCN